MKNRAVAAVSVILFLAAAPLVGAGPAPPAHRLAGAWPVGGGGGWDYVTVDAAARRVYVAHATRIDVLDADSGKKVGEVPAEGAHGVAIAPDLKKGFSTNGRAGTVTVFDTGTLAVTATVKATGENPDAILYEPVTKRVFAFNGRGRNVTAIDAASNAVVGTLPAGGKPEFAVSDAAGVVYVNVEDTAEIVAFDAKSLTVRNRWSLAPCADPTGLAFDPKGRRLFAGCGNKLMAVVSADSGKVLGTVPIGAGCDGTAFDAASGLAFASAGDGTLTAVAEPSPGVFEAVETIPTKKGARTLALDPAKHRILLPARGDAFEILIVEPR